MKKIGFRIILALVMSLVLILGTVSLVEAKGNPHRNASVTAIATLDGGTYDLSFNLSWYAYRVKVISYEWWHYEIDSWVPSGIGSTPTLNKVIRNYSSNFNNSSYNPQDVSSGEQWKINVVLYQPSKGKYFTAAVALDDNITVGS